MRLPQIALRIVAATALPAAATAQTVSHVDIEPRAVTLGIGERRELVATAYDANGRMLSAMSFEWVSGNLTVVRIEPDPGIEGLAYLVGVAPGLTQVEVRADGQTGAAVVHVTGEVQFVDRFQEFTVVPRSFEHDADMSMYEMIGWRELSLRGGFRSTFKPARSRF